MKERKRKERKRKRRRRRRKGKEKERKEKKRKEKERKVLKVLKMLKVSWGSPEIVLKVLEVPIYVGRSQYQEWWFNLAGSCASRRHFHVGTLTLNPKP